MASTKYCKSLGINHNQQFLKSRKKIGDVIPVNSLQTKHTNIACDGDLRWT